MESAGFLPTAQNCEWLSLLLEHGLPDDYADLLVPPRALTDPTGKRLQRKRALLRQFDAACPHHTAVPIGAHNLDQAYRLERLWQTPGGDCKQLTFVRNCFRSFGTLGLRGVLLGDGTRAVGYAMAADCGTTGAYLLVLRALTSPAGVTAALYREAGRLAKTVLPELRWINLGWLGGAGEAHIRLSYDPLTPAQAEQADRQVTA